MVVYGLYSTEDDRIRYIGQTVRDMSHRMKGHRQEARRFPHRRLSKWLQSVSDSGHLVEWQILNADAIWHITEMQTIQHYKNAGHDLVNETLGGDGTLGRIYRPWSAEHKAKMSAKMKGRKKPAGFSERASARMKGIIPSGFADPAAKAKAIAARVGIIPKNLAAIHASMVGKPKPDAVKRKISSTLSGRKQPPELVAKRAATFRAFLAANPGAVERRKATLAAARKATTGGCNGLVS